MDCKSFLRISFLFAVSSEIALCIDNENVQYPPVREQPRNLIMRLPTRTRDEIIRIARSHPASIYNHPIFQNPEVFKVILSAYTTVYKLNVQSFIKSNTQNGLQTNRKYTVTSDFINPKIRVIVEESGTNPAPDNHEGRKCDVSNSENSFYKSGGINVNNGNCERSKYNGIYNGNSRGINNGGVDNIQSKDSSNGGIYNGNRRTSNIEGIGNCEKNEGINEGNNYNPNRGIEVVTNCNISVPELSHCEVQDYSSVVQLHVQMKDKLLRRLKKITKDLEEWNPELTEGTSGPTYRECGYINKLKLIGLSLIDLGNFLLDDDPRKELCVIVGDELDSDTGLYPPGCFRI